MKGIIINLLEDFIKENLGEERYEELLEACFPEPREPFVGPGSYPDKDLTALIDKTVDALGTTESETLHAFGRHCIRKLARRFPSFFNQHHHAKAFLMTVNSIHELEVKKLYADADPPRFMCEEPSPDRLIMRYDSARRLCPLIEGLIEGVAEHYGSSIRYKQLQCMLHGAQTCAFELDFSRERVTVT